MPVTESRRTDIRPLLPLYLVVFVAFIGYAMMVTFFVPLLMDNHGFLPATASVARRSMMVGILLAVYPLGQFFGSPILGAISDRFGRKPVLLGSLVLSILSYVFIAWAIHERQFVVLTIACLVGGLGEANIAIAQSAVADFAGPEDRGRLFAYIYTASSCGYISGPLIGPLIAARFGFAVPFWGVLVLLVLTAVWVAAAFRETHAPDKNRKLDYVRTLMSLGTVFTDRPIRPLYLINFIFYLTIFGFYRVILMYMDDKWHMSVHESGLYYSYLSVMSLVASLFCVAPLLRRFPLKSVAVSAALLAGVLIMIIVLPQNHLYLLVTAGPATVAATITLATCATLLSNVVEAERQGGVMGNNQALQVGAEALGALIGGLLAAILVPLPLLVYGVLLLIGGLMLMSRRVAPASVSGALPTPVSDSAGLPAESAAG